MTLGTIEWSFIITVLTSALASSGMWAFITKRTDNKCAESRMLLGLAHDRIINMGLHYIERKYITADEYENLHDYLYVPYCALGGNGSAKRIMEEVSRLPLSKYAKHYEKDDTNKNIILKENQTE